MTAPQTTLLVILALTLAGFIWGRFRHDVVALAALMAAVVTGLVAPERAFGGFGHPAVITVACVLVLSQSLQHTGAIDALQARNRGEAPDDAPPEGPSLPEADPRPEVEPRLETTSPESAVIMA